MRRKGQMGFFVILGIIVVVAVVIILTYSTSTITPSNVPQTVAQQQKLVSDSVINVGRAGASEAIKWVEQQGGFIEPDYSNSVLFNKVAVPYWQMCGDTSRTPGLNDIRDRIEDAVWKYINGSVAAKQVYYGKNVTYDLSRLEVDASINENKIDFLVTLPTSVNGYPIRQPYTFTAPTNLGRIYEFGSAFVIDNANKRMLEQFTINTIYFSDEIETQGVLTECGDGIYQTGEQISRALMKIIDHTLANIIWWQPMPAADDETKVYSIETVGGKEYTDLEVRLYLPDGFDLSRSNPMHISNSKHIARVAIWDIPVCITPYNWKYSVDYPAIVRVKDELTGDYMNFAVMVDINEMDEGDCSEYVSSTINLSLGCSARLRIVDSSGSPIENATASFSGMYIGESGADGIIQGPVPCGTGNITMSHPEYGLYELETDDSNINGSYTLLLKPEMEANFRQVSIDTQRTIFWIPVYHKCTIKHAINQISLDFQSNRGQYYVSNINSMSADFSCLESGNCDRCSATSNLTACRMCIDACNTLFSDAKTVNYIPGDEYTIRGDMWNMVNFKAAGAFMKNYEILETDDSYYFYVPTDYSLYIDDSVRKDLTEDMKWKCDLDPVYGEEQNSRVNMKMGCSCERLEELVDNEFGSCINSTQRLAMFSPCNKAMIFNTIKNSCGYEVIGC